MLSWLLYHILFGLSLTARKALTPLRNLDAKALGVLLADGSESSHHDVKADTKPASAREEKLSLSHAATQMTASGALGSKGYQSARERRNSSTNDILPLPIVGVSFYEKAASRPRPIGIHTDQRATSSALSRSFSARSLARFNSVA